MLAKIVSVMLIVSSFFVASPSFLLGQGAQTKQQKQAENVKAKVRQFGTGNRAIVKVKLYDNTTYQGYIDKADEDDFVVVDTAGRSNTVNYSDVKTIGGKNLSTGAKIAIGAGIAGGITAVVLLLVFHHITRNN